jgi:MoaA/NifB/PqqE/SkfB family radical SAM enzyme
MSEAGTRIGFVLRNALVVADVVLARRLRSKPHFMPVLLLFTTWRCNLNCSMCGVRKLSDEAIEPELSVEEYDGIFRAAQRLKTSLMLISGGEALTRGKILFEIIARGRRHGIATHLCSNGGLITDEVADALRAAGTHSVSISLESPSAEVNDRIRGEGSHAKAIEALARLRERAPEIRLGINCTLTAINYRDASAMVGFAEKLGVRQIKFAPIHTNLLHREKTDFDELVFTEEMLPSLQKEMDTLANAVKRAKILTTSPYFIRRIVDSYRRRQPFRCFAGYAACAVDPYGAASPCPDVQGGLSLRKRPLDELWRSKEFAELRRRVDACEQHCWDTLYTEMSLRLGEGSLWSSFMRTWRELSFYYRMARK